MTHYSYTFSNLPRVSWNPIGPVSFGCWFWSHIIDKNRLSTKPRDFIADIPCFDMRWMWANSKIRIFVCRTLSLSLLKNQITWNSPKKLDMVFQNLKIIPILSIRSTIPICPLHWVLTSWIIWGPFSNLFWLIEVVTVWITTTKYQFETVTESAVNISFHSLSDGGLNFCSSSKLTSKYIFLCQIDQNF